MESALAIDANTVCFKSIKQEGTHGDELPFRSAIAGGDLMFVRLFRLWGLAVLLALQGCASSLSSGSTTQGDAPSQVQVKPGRAPIPGGYWMYSFGSGQTKTNFENIEIAQYDYALWPGRHWKRMGPYTTYVTANRIGLQVYYPLHVRWKLKDGREFILENIDVPAIMREYFKTHSLQLQWQREGRKQDRVGDDSPTLAHEVKDDTVILKWVITLNRTPVNERLTPSGAATKWDIYQEEHTVVILKGNPTSGIDFSKTDERRQ